MLDAHLTTADSMLKSGCLPDPTRRLRFSWLILWYVQSVVVPRGPVDIKPFKSKALSQNSDGNDTLNAKPYITPIYPCITPIMPKTALAVPLPAPNSHALEAVLGEERNEVSSPPVLRWEMGEGIPVPKGLRTQIIGL